jgi:hypothetical protein
MEVDDEDKANLKEKDEVIVQLQRDLKQSQKYPQNETSFEIIFLDCSRFSTSLEKVVKEYQEFVEELQVIVNMPCKKCGAVSSMDASFVFPAHE